MILYNEAKRLITMAAFEDNAVVYVKGREKRTWLRNFWTMSENASISKPWMQFAKTWNFLSNLDVTNTICGHVKNCALQNVLKIHKLVVAKEFFK